MNNIRFTIITVCFNAEKVIEKTICSVINQTYSNIEYIIVDGGSSDNTIGIISDYAKIKPIKWISEKDQGIYDAMNKGLLFATGDYIHFLNAGDTFIDEDLLYKTARFIANKTADIFYGNIIYCHENGKETVRSYGKWCGKKVYFLTGDCINHQAIFAKKEYLIKDKFNIEYSICADREWMIRILQKKAKFLNMGYVVCKYSLDKNSISIIEKEKYQKEAQKCIKKNFPHTYFIFEMFEFLRNDKILRWLLHAVYKIIYIRKV